MTSAIAFILIPTMLLLQPTTPATTATPPVAVGVAGQTTESLPSVDEVLTKLETADKDLTGLKANIRYIKKPPAIEGGGTQSRYGTIAYAVNPSPEGKGGVIRKFNIHFDQLMYDNILRPNDKKTYIFDGATLIELDHLAKQYTRKHIVGPNQTKDPLRIGEGPFPIPVGQRKADLLARFDVSVVPVLENTPENEKLRAVLASCVQLKLTPKAGTEQSKTFSQIRLWYRQSDMLPIFAQTVNVDGSSAEVFLVDLKKNPDLPASTFDTNPPNGGAGWQGSDEDLRDKAVAVPEGGVAPPTTPTPTKTP